MTRICFIACSKSKKPGGNPWPAVELYTSLLFRWSVAYARSIGAEVYVLSAKHGLLPADKLTEWYDWSLAEMSAAARKKWSDRVFNQVTAATYRPGEQLELIVLAGKHYCLPFDDNDIDYKNPLHGKGIGQRLAWLKANTKAPEVAQ